MGNPIHENHPRTPGSKHLIPARLISRTEEQLVFDLANADASLGTMRNAIHAKSGKVYNRNTLFHIRGLCGIINKLESGLRDCSSTELMIKFMEERGYEYMMLMHCPFMNSIIHQTMRPPFTNTHPSVVSFPPIENDDVVSFVTTRRVSLSVTNEQQFMMAFAWATPKEKRMFELFPSVLYVDTTCDTNNEGRPLLSINGKDTSSRPFTVLRALLPNQ